MINSFEFLGFFAGALTTGAFIPQVLKVIKTKSAGDFSWGWLGMTLMGVITWMIYGVLLGSYSL
ncbi:MAG: SemiSWEET family sugar transporter, partial [Candidatus Thorarchaeota archaeon]